MTPIKNHPIRALSTARAGLTRRLFTAAAFATAAAGLSAPAAAQPAFPQKTVTLVVWSGAGGALDTYGRKLAELLEREVGWSVKVDNRPGGSGSVGVSRIMNQPADGYQILVLTSTLTFGIAQGLIPFKIDDLRLLRAMQSEPSSLAVLADSKLKTVADFVDYMKANPNGLKVGGHAPGGFHQFMLYQLMQAGKFEAGWIPHDASGKVTLGLLGRHIDVAMMTPSTGLAQVQSGEFRLLGISTETRSEFLPNVPTFREQGYKFDGSLWRGIAVRKGTPDNVVDAIQGAIDKVTASADWKKFQVDQYQDSPNWGEKDFTRHANEELTDQAAFLKAAGFLK